MSHQSAGGFSLIGAIALEAMVALGCGDSDRRPDTGVGAGQTPPATETCADLCQRLTDCLIILCNEDKHTTQYEVLRDAVTADCNSKCTDQLVMSTFSPTVWQCTFQSSCRQVLDYETCYSPASYSCT